MPPPPRETLIYSVWRTCFTFFETVEDGRVHSCLKKDRALPNEITARFQEALNQCLPEAFRIENEMFSMQNCFKSRHFFSSYVHFFCATSQENSRLAHLQPMPLALIAARAYVATVSQGGVQVPTGGDAAAYSSRQPASAHGWGQQIR